MGQGTLRCCLPPPKASVGQGWGQTPPWLWQELGAAQGKAIPAALLPDGTRGQWSLFMVPHREGWLCQKQVLLSRDGGDTGREVAVAQGLLCSAPGGCSMLGELRGPAHTDTKPGHSASLSPCGHHTAISAGDTARSAVLQPPLPALRHAAWK